MLEIFKIPEAPDKLQELRKPKIVVKCILSTPTPPEPPQGERGKEELSHFLDKLVRLIPGEAIALYIFAQGLIGQARPLTLIGWSVFCLFIAGLARYIGTKDVNKSPQWGAVTIACISFVIWVYNIGGPFLLIPNLHDPVIAALVVAGWTTLTTMLYEPRKTA